MGPEEFARCCLLLGVPRESVLKLWAIYKRESGLPFAPAAAFDRLGGGGG